MTEEKRRFWLPLTGLLLASAAAIICNIAATADPAGERPALNLVMTLIFIAAWVLFFAYYQSRSKAAYIVGLVYWGFVLLYGITCVFPAVMELFQFASPLMPVIMALLAPLMGLIVMWDFAGVALLFVISAVFAGLSIYKLCKMKRTAA
ncbi:MAG: hypothetical protein IJR51_01845 [Clostridia bacterium]|nr:hypothetical protein [Clostridia bacterium]